MAVLCINIALCFRVFFFFTKVMFVAILLKFPIDRRNLTSRDLIGCYCCWLNSENFDVAL